MEPQDFDAASAPAFDPAAAAAPDAAPTASESEVIVDGEGASVGDHVIEHRSFGRADASAPMPVTVITTRDSLRNTGA